MYLVGAVSVILWALMLVVTLKYVILILRADNRGEGGGLGADGTRHARGAGASRLAPRAAAAGRVRRHALLRRQRHHAGDLGARRDGGWRS
ncbi:MAG: KUP/HAK/KT family potassium transporter [Rubrivivax sp.]